MRRFVTSTNFLRAVATLIVAGVFVAAGAAKLIGGDAGQTMVGRYFNGADGIRALGCIELALALWLISFRTPRLAGMVAVGALLAMSGLIAMELTRERPLPCGCLRADPGIDPFEVRHSLKLSLWRNGFLIALALLSVALAPPDRATDSE